MDRGDSCCVGAWRCVMVWQACRHGRVAVGGRGALRRRIWPVWHGRNRRRCSRAVAMFTQFSVEDTLVEALCPFHCALSAVTELHDQVMDIVARRFVSPAAPEVMGERAIQPEFFFTRRDGRAYSCGTTYRINSNTKDDASNIPARNQCMTLN